jgi:hypothetical protein
MIMTMWENANGVNFDPLTTTFDIKEMSLTGNMLLTEMLDRKIKWKTVDDIDNQERKLDYTMNATSITLEPQRIRMFEIQVA